MITKKLFDCGTVPSISELQWARMRPFLEREESFTFDVEDLAKKGRINRTQSLAVLFALQGAGLARLYWHIYHRCSRSKPVASRLIRLGFLPMPWRCPNCKARVDDPNVPRYGVYATLSKPIRLSKDSSETPTLKMRRL